jgi:hypothetical protein
MSPSATSNALSEIEFQLSLLRVAELNSGPSRQAREVERLLALDWSPELAPRTEPRA